VITVYKKLVQGLIYSPPDCDKYLALDAKPQGSVALALTLAPTVAAQLGVYSACKGKRESSHAKWHDTRAPYTRLTFNCVPALAVRTTSRLTLLTRRPTRRTLSGC
jgi:hypothetical protein